MMKKKILSLCMVAIMLNLSVESYAYSLNNIQLATSSDLTNNPSGGDTPSGDGGAEQPPSAPPGGSNSGSSTQPPNSNGGSTGAGGAGGSTTTPSTPPENKGSNNVELEGGIGEWGPDKDSSLPNFNETTGSEKTDVDNEPQKDQYFTISATVPLNMEFLIKNKDKHGFSTEGIFISPYYKVINNGSHTLKVHFESFEYATSSSNKTSGLIQEELEKLYVVKTPKSGNGKVEMKLNLTYDRPSNPYVKKINLVPPENSSTITSKLLKSTNSVEQVLGLLDPNEQARLYYGSDLWETPKSENVEKGVEANFNLKLAFSIEGKTTETNSPSESPGDTTPDTSPSQPPSAPTPSQPSNGTTSGDTSQSSPGSSTQGQQPNGDTSSEVQNPAGNGQQGQRN